MSERVYKDSDGNEVTLTTMCRREPEWAASRIRIAEAAWCANLAANLAAAGMAATLDRWSRYPCDDGCCLACNADWALDTMREAVS